MDPATGLLLLALYAFGPRPKVLQPKPDTAAVAAAQAQANEARAALQKAEVELEAARGRLAESVRAQELHRNEVIAYAQETNEMAAQALALVPAEHRTAEVVLAAELVGRTGSSLAALLGSVAPERRADLLLVVRGLLSKTIEEREAARAKLAEKDAQLAATLRDLAVEKAQGEMLAKAVEAKTLETKEAKAEVAVRDSKLESKTVELMHAADRLRGEDGFFWRVILWIIALWLWFTRVLPALAKVHPTFAWLERVNAFVFHLLTGQSAK